MTPTILPRALKPLARAACALACTAAAWLAAPGVHAAPTLSLQGPAAVASGARFDLTVAASGFDDLYAWQFSLLFDPAVFQVLTVTPGSLLSAAGATVFDPGLIDNAAGSVAWVLESLIGAVPGARGDGTLAVLGLQASGAASVGSTLRLSDVLAYDAGLNLLTVQTADQVVAVPEPTAAALVLLALAAAGLGHAATAARRRAPGADPSEPA